MLDVLRQSKTPAVVDADAITMLAKNPEVLDEMDGLPRLLTPHPGQLQRLLDNFPGWRGMDRRTVTELLVKAHPKRTLLLKGARTVIATAGEVTLFNSPGHPGMASGGMGYVLTGVCAAFAARRIGLHHAAGLGSNGFVAVRRRLRDVMGCARVMSRRISVMPFETLKRAAGELV